MPTMKDDHALPAVRFSRRRPGRRYLALALVFVVAIVYAWLFSSYLNSHVTSTETMLRENLKNMVQVARNTIEPVLEQVRKGDISPEQGLEQVRPMMRNMRYGPDNYLFMFSYQGVQLVQPIAPEMEGGNAWDFKGPEGSYIVRDLLKVAREHPEGGYLTYLFDGPPAKEVRQKASFVLDIPELSAVIGTGAYVDDLRRERREFLIQATLMAVAVFLLVALPSGIMLILLHRRNQDLEREFTVRQRVEQVMLESEQRYRALYDNAPIGICQTTPEGSLLRVNPALARMAGYKSSRDMLENADNVADTFYPRPEDREHFLKELREKGHVSGVELQLRRRDGSSAWGDINSRLTKAEDGRVLYIESFLTDVTDRRRAEEELRVSEERYRLVTLLPDQVVWDHDIKSGEVRWTGDVQGMFGFDLREGLERIEFWIDRIHPDDQAGFRNMLNSVMESGDSVEHETRFLKEDGSTIVLEHRGVVLRDSRGRPYRVIGTLRDVTPRREAEEALRRSEATLRAMLTASRDRAYLVDVDGVILAANEQASRYSGLSLEDLPGTTFFEWLDPVLAEARSKGIKDAVRYKEPVWIVDDLNNESVEVIYYPVQDDAGHVDRVAIFARDITEQRDAERALRASERRLRSIFENAPVGIFQSDVEGVFLSVNQELAGMLGYESSRDLMENIPDSKSFYLDSSQLIEVRDQLFGQGEVTDMAIKVRRRDESMAWLSLSAVALRNSAGVFERVEGFLLDVTERIRAERALKESEEKYRDLFESAADAIFVVDQDIIVDCNQAVKDMFGLDRTEMFGASIWDISTPEQPVGGDTRVYGPQLHRQVLAGEQKRFEWTFQHVDGHPVHAEVSLNRIEVGGEPRLLAMLRDVSERKLAEQQRMMFERIASASNDHMTFVDMDLTYMAANEAYAEALGSTPQDILGKTVPEVFGPQGWEAVRQYVQRCQNGETVTYSQWLDLPGLGRRYMEAAYFPYFDESGVQTGIVASRRDITDRKRIQDALLESERRYRLLAENAADVIWLMDQNMRLTYISPAVEGFVGYTSREVLQKPQEGFFAKEAWQELEGALHGLAGDKREKGAPAPARRLELPFMHKDGRELWAEVVVTTIRSRGGELEGFQGVTRDITDRKQAREALARSLRFEKVVDLCAKKLLSASSKEDVLGGVLLEILRASEVSRAYVFLNFQDPEEGLCCRQAHEVCAPGVEPQIDNPGLQKVPYRTMAPFFQARLSRGQGISTPVKDLPEPERSGLQSQDIRSILVLPLMIGGAWQGFIGYDDVRTDRVWDQSERLFLETVVDIVGAYYERMRAEQDLLQAYAELDQIFNSSGNGMALFDLDGTVLRVNKPFLEMFNLPPEGVLGRKCHEVVPDDCRKRKNCPARVTLEGATHEGHEFCAESEVDGKHWYAVSSAPFFNAQGELSGTVVTYRDITRRKQAQMESMQRQEQLIQADKLASLGTLVSGVAHEINNPNGIITLNAPTLSTIWQGVRPVLEERYDEEGDFKVGDFSYSQVRGEVDYLFEQVIESGRRIKRIVAELKDFARQEAADMSQRVDLVEVIQAAVGLVSNKIKKSTSDFRLDLPHKPVEVMGNFQRLEQVLINVLINACEALTETTQSVRVTLEREAKSGMGVIKVRDQGQGITKEAMKHIFDPFFTTKRDSGGTGLGLSVSHGIIQEHQGVMAYDSEPGKGTLCTIRIPLMKPAPQNQDGAGRAKES